RRVRGEHCRRPARVPDAAGPGRRPHRPAPLHRWAAGQPAVGRRRPRVARRPARRRTARPTRADVGCGHARGADPGTGTRHASRACADRGRARPAVAARRLGDAARLGARGWVRGDSARRGWGGRRAGAVPSAAAVARRTAMTVSPTARVPLLAVTTDPLDVPAHEAAVADPRAGAVVVFQGVVRDHDRGRAVAVLEYEAHPSAAEVLREVAMEIDRKSTRLNSSHVKISYAV